MDHGRSDMASIKTSHLRDGLNGCWDCEDRRGLSKRCTLPLEFLAALRGCLEAGMTCEMITAFLDVSAGLWSASREIGADELRVRVNHIVEVMGMTEEK